MKFLTLALVLGAIGFFLLAIGTKGFGFQLRYKAQPIMTPNEVEFFWRICEAVPTGYVFPQVAMSALIQPDAAPGKRYMAAFGRIAQKRIDYAVYDAAMTLRAVIELDDRTHNAKQDALRDSYLASAGIATLRFQSKRKPSAAEIQTALQQVQAP